MEIHRTPVASPSTHNCRPTPRDHYVAQPSASGGYSCTIAQHHNHLTDKHGRTTDRDGQARTHYGQMSWRRSPR